MNLKSFLIFILTAGALDIGSTMIGLSLGLIETNPHFLQFPFVASCLLLVWGIISDKIPDAPKRIKRGVTGWLCFLAFFPGIWNISLIIYKVFVL